MTISNGHGGTVTQAAAVTLIGVNDLPAISGTLAGQAAGDKTAIKPFALAAVSDPDAGAQDSLTIRLLARRAPPSTATACSPGRG